MQKQSTFYYHAGSFEGPKTRLWCLLIFGRMDYEFEEGRSGISPQERSRLRYDTRLVRTCRSRLRLGRNFHHEPAVGRIVV